MPKPDADFVQAKDCAGISVVIRTFNSAGTLPLVIDRLGLGGNDELIIVDSGSTDDTLRLAEACQARVVKAEGPFNYSRSLNLGFAAARNAWVLALSSHCIPIVSGHLAVFRKALEQLPGRIAVVYGPCRYSMGGRPSFSAPAPVAIELKEWDRRRQWFGSNSNALYQKALWVEHRFDETLPTAEDLEWFLWALRQGHAVGQAPEAGVLYRNAGGMRRLFRKGLQESALGMKLTGSEGMSVWGLAIGLGSFGKKLLLREIPFQTFLGQSAHHLGAFLGGRAGRKR